MAPHEGDSRGPSRGGRRGLDAARLIAWYERVKRDLPWRGSEEPYEILVSEIMLQQTRVEVVERYYREFLGRFPTVEALAGAEDDEVLARWSGLGYYRRARLLHRAARAVVERGSWPRSARELRELPGIGDYTGAAVASIAFGEVVLALDGNGERVLARRVALDEDPRRASGRRVLRAAGDSLLDPRRPGDSNQALMELGATVCRPRSPRCLACPLAEGCSALASGSAEAYPVRRSTRERVAVRWLLAVVRSRGRVLLVRRPPAAGLSDGPWSLPTIEIPAGGDIPAAADLERRLSEELGGEWKVDGRSALARHAVTYRDVELVVVEARLASRRDRLRAEARDFDVGSLGELPTTAVLGKGLGALERSSGAETGIRARRAVRNRPGHRPG